MATLLLDGGRILKKPEIPQHAARPLSILRPHQQVDVGRRPSAGFRKVAVRRVGPLEHADLDASVGERSEQSLELMAHAGGAAPTVIQVSRDQVRNRGWRRDATGLAPE